MSRLWTYPQCNEPYMFAYKWENLLFLLPRKDKTPKIVTIKGL